jgi:hypothetical protein
MALVTKLLQDNSKNIKAILILFAANLLINVDKLEADNSSLGSPSSNGVVASQLSGKIPLPEVIEMESIRKNLIVVNDPASKIFFNRDNFSGGEDSSVAADGGASSSPNRSYSPRGYAPDHKLDLTRDRSQKKSEQISGLQTIQQPSSMTSLPIHMREILELASQEKGESGDRIFTPQLPPHLP